MNRAAYGVWSPAERGAANMNIVTGALGAVRGAHGDFRALIEEPVASPYSPPLGWALRAAASRPLSFARAAALRVLHALSLRPLLLVLSFTGFLLLRRREDLRQVWLLMAYFVAVNCLMSIEDDYFDPLWAVAAAAAAGAWVSRVSGDSGAPLARPVLLGGLALALSGALACETAVGLYAWRRRARAPESAAALEEALARHPADAWLLLSRGRRRLGEKDPAGALADFSAARERLPDLPSLALEEAWARLERGEAGPALALDCPGPRSAPYGDGEPARPCLYRALARLRTGKASAAAADLESALAAWSEWQTLNHPAAGPEELAAQRALEEGAEAGFWGRAEHLLEGKPAEGRLDLLEALARLRPDRKPFWTALHREAAQAGRVEVAGRALRRLEALAQEPEELRELARLHQRLGRPSEALPLYARLLRTSPRDASLLKDLGICEFEAGLTRRAARSLGRALELEPRDAETALSLGAVLAREGRKAEAAAVYAKTLARGLPRSGPTQALERALGAEKGP